MRDPLSERYQEEDEVPVRNQPVFNENLIDEDSSLERDPYTHMMEPPQYNLPIDQMT